MSSNAFAACEREYNAQQHHIEIARDERARNIDQRVIEQLQREALADLRRQEILLDDADCKRKAAEQLARIEEKGSEQHKQVAAEKAQENLRKGVAGAAEAATKAQAQSQKATEAAERRNATLANQARKAAEAPERDAAQAEAQTRAADLRQRQQDAATRKADRERRLQQAPPTDRQPLPLRP